MGIYMNNCACFISTNKKLEKENILDLEKLINELTNTNICKNFLFFNLDNLESNAYKIISKNKKLKKIVCKKNITLKNNKVIFNNVMFDKNKSDIHNNFDLINASKFCIFLNISTDLVNLYNSTYFELLTYAKSKNRVILFV